MTRNLARFDPFAEFKALQNRLLENDWLTPFKPAGMPTTDVYTQGDDHLVVEAHLPGFADKDVEVSVDDGDLIIQGERHEKEEDKDKKDKKYVVRESSSSYYRRIALPELADDAKVEAEFTNGVLRVTVPFRAPVTPRKIEVNSGTAETAGEEPSKKAPETTASDSGMHGNAA